MLRRHIVLLIAIRPSDGDVKPGGPLGAFREEQAMSQHRVSPSLFLSSSHTIQLHYANSYTYSHPNLNFLQHYTDTLPTRNVVYLSGARFENRPHSTPSIIHPPCAEPEARNSAVGWHWNTHTHTIWLIKRDTFTFQTYFIRIKVDGQFLTDPHPTLIWSAQVVRD